MDEDEGVHAEEDLLVGSDAGEEDLDPEFDEQSEESDHEEGGGVSASERAVYAVFKPKLVKILRDLLSPEVKIYSEASKEFVDLLRSDSGGEILLEYVKSSPGCPELEESWRAHRGKPGMSHILSLFSAVLGHPLGKSRSSGISRNLDNFARLVISSKMDDIYVELNSSEARRQSAALFLLASVVRRGVSLASEVGKAFNFKLPVLSKLSGRKKRSNAKVGKEGERRTKRFTRRAFVEFAISFLEVGNPRLLRWILQQREMYSSVLQMLGSDDVETVVYVLSTLRDKVLVPESLVPPGLRSVLFGSVALEQLIHVSGNLEAGPDADAAHEVLLSVCTDPANGLMPGLNLKGNEKRLFELMKKLKATEVWYHKELLLGIVKCRPSLCSAYMDEFPYHLEPRPSSLWFVAISLAADMISSMDVEAFIVSLGNRSYDSGMDELQSILKCIIPQSFTRSVINKGLLHPDILVKHGSLRLLLESVKLVSSLINRIDEILESSKSRQIMETSGEGMTGLYGLRGLSLFADVERYLQADELYHPCSDGQGYLQWGSVKQYIQDDVRALLPDPQVLIKLLSSSSSTTPKVAGLSLKRCASMTKFGLQKLKKLKSECNDETVDLIFGGINDDLALDNSESQEKDKNGSIKQQSDMGKNFGAAIAEIWGLKEEAATMDRLMDPEVFLNCRLLDILTFYLRTMPAVVGNSFDFFKVLPVDPLSLSFDHQKSLFSLLVEYSRQSPGNKASTRAPEQMYRHLQPLLNTLIFSEVENIKDQAYTLARAAMISTGAFEQNLLEVDMWLCLIPGYKLKQCPGKSEGAVVGCDLSKGVISFLSDAVSTIGNNIHKHIDQMRKLILEFDEFRDCSPGFSPLTICILQKCLRLLESNSVNFKLHEKLSISLYVFQALSTALQLEVGTNVLPRVIHLVLSEKFKDSCSAYEDSKTSFCEWRPLRNLLLFAQNILDQHSCTFFSFSESTVGGSDNSLILVLEKVKELAGQEEAGCPDKVGNALLSSVLCAAPDDVLKAFPLLITIAQPLFGSQLQFLSMVFSLDPELLANVASQWPDMFFSALEMIKTNSSSNCRADGHVISHESTSFPVESILTSYVDQSRTAAASFSLLLKQTPFYVLLYAVMSHGTCKLDLTGLTEILNLLRSIKVSALLQVKLFEGLANSHIPYLRCLLFWMHQIFTEYRDKPGDVLEELFHICVVLVEHVFEHLVLEVSNTAGSKTLSRYSGIHCLQDAVNLIFCHPVITSSFLCPLSSGKIIGSVDLSDGVEAFLTSSKQSYHPMDRHIVEFLKKVVNYLMDIGNWSTSPDVDYPIYEQTITAPTDLVEEMLLLFKGKFDICILTRDVGPLLTSFYAFHTLLQLTSPFELFKIAQWMFFKVEEDASSYSSPYVPAVCVALFVYDIALDLLYGKFQQPVLKGKPNLLLNLKVRDFDVSILTNTFYMVLDFAICLDLQCAYGCLLKALNIVYYLKFGKPQPALLPFYMLLYRVIISCSFKMLVYLLHPASKVKSKALFRLLEVCPVHVSLFGKILLGIINEDMSVLDALNVGGACSTNGEIVNTKCSETPSEDDFVLFIPAALSYFKHSFHRSPNQDIMIFKQILEFYSRILLGGFSNWKAYVSRDIFHEQYDILELGALKDFSQHFYCSLLGKAVCMLHFSFVLDGSSIGKKQKMKIFDSMYGHSSPSDELLDGDLKRIGTFTYNDSLNLVNAVTAKISFTRLLLFPPNKWGQFVPTGVGGESAETPTTSESNRLNSSRVRFLNILINTLDLITEKCPMKKDTSCTPCSSDYFGLLRFIEVILLQNVVQLSTEINSYLTQLPSIGFLIPFIRSSLLHRFEDPIRIKAIRCLLAKLSEASFSSDEVIELLLGHSKFVSMILCSNSISDPSLYMSSGTFLQPVPSILKSIVFPSIENHPQEDKGNFIGSMISSYKFGALDERKLELIKLLRVLYCIKDKQKTKWNVNFVGLNPKALVSLLLSGYGATLSEIDLEALHLIHEIELISGSPYDIITELDYLWGAAALKAQEELACDRWAMCKKGADIERIEEQRRRLFRENISVDTNLCIRTILCFCNDRATRTSPFSLEGLVEDTFSVSEESTKKDVVQGYDPAFILRFAVHSLRMDYIEPIEFTRLGLLAVTLVSISSTDEEIRKLGYESLGRFKKKLENLRSKDVLQLQLLLTYLQNGIAEPWQKIPSVIAIFAAEASFVLLDPSNNFFHQISKLLVHSPRVNLKTVPLSQMLLASDSVHSRTDSLWILRLLYAGLNSNDDAKIYLNNKLFELLLGYFSSSLSDLESNTLILQIIKKSVKLHMLANYLVKECGLVSWLSFVLSSYGAQLIGDQKDHALKAMQSVLEVINHLMSVRTITEWLQDYALEQLSELSSRLHLLFLGAIRLLKDNISLVNSMLHVMGSTLRISQRRKIYQPHFTLSLEGLLRLFQEIGLGNVEPNVATVLGMDTLLMSMPIPVTSHMEKAQLAKVLIWAISTSGQSSSESKEPNHSMFLVKEKEEEESVVSKLLRWATASVLLGQISDRSPKQDQELLLRRSGLRSLQSLIEAVLNKDDENGEKDFSANEALSAIILYLQPLQGMNFVSLPSVISALSLLVLSSSIIAGKGLLDEERGKLALLCSKVRCPVEANPSWRWSYDQPWKDLSFQQTQIEELEERHACQSLLVIFSSALGGKPSGLPSLAHLDLERSGLFEWERENFLW